MPKNRAEKTAQRFFYFCKANFDLLPYRICNKIVKVKLLADSPLSFLAAIARINQRTIRLKSAGRRYLAAGTALRRRTANLCSTTSEIISSKNETGSVTATMPPKPSVCIEKPAIM
jgi:hypothetical protein